MLIHQRTDSTERGVLDTAARRVRVMDESRIVQSDPRRCGKINGLFAVRVNQAALEASEIQMPLPIRPPNKTTRTNPQIAYKE